MLLRDVSANCNDFLSKLKYCVRFVIIFVERVAGVFEHRHGDVTEAGAKEEDGRLRVTGGFVSMKRYLLGFCDAVSLRVRTLGCVHISR